MAVRSFVLGLACLVALTSCGRAAPSRRPTVPVQGRLLFQGRPAAGAQVVLQPADVETQRADWSAGFPRGRVAGDGQLVLSTYDTADGAPAGRYVLVATWFHDVLPDNGEQSDDDSLSLPDRLQGRFADPATSPLKVAIEGPRVDLGLIELSSK